MAEESWVLCRGRGGEGHSLGTLLINRAQNLTRRNGRIPRQLTNGPRTSSFSGGIKLSTGLRGASEGQETVIQRTCSISEEGRGVLMRREKSGPKENVEGKTKQKRGRGRIVPTRAGGRRREEFFHK